MPRARTAEQQVQFWNEVTALWAELKSGSRDAEQVLPWIQQAVQGEFDKLPFNHPLPLTPFMPPEVQWRYVRQLNRERRWGFSDEEINAAAPSSDVVLNHDNGGQLITTVLVAYLATPARTAKEWWNVATSSPYQGDVACGNHFINFFGDDCIRLRPWLVSPIQTLRWEMLDLSYSGLLEYDADPECYPHAQLLAAAAHHRALAPHFNGSILNWPLLSGYQVRQSATDKWEQTLSLRWKASLGHLELAVEDKRSRASCYCLPRVSPLLPK